MKTGMWCRGFVLHNKSAGKNAIRSIESKATTCGLSFGYNRFDEENIRN